MLVTIWVRSRWERYDTLDMFGKLRIKLHGVNNSGQALLAVVLVLVVALTVGLSVATRNITNVRLTSDEQASQRALSAAEAGIEQAIKVPTQRGIIIGAGGVTPIQTVGDASIEKVNVVSQAGSEILLNGGNPIPRNESVDIWLANPTTFASPWTGLLYVHWSSPAKGVCAAGTESSNAAMMITTFSKPDNNLMAVAEIKNYPFDPCSTRRTGNNFCPRSGANYCLDASTADNAAMFTTTSVTVPASGGKTFQYAVRLAFGDASREAPKTGILVRITPLYVDTVVGLRGRLINDVTPLAIPEQGTVIESTGSSGSTQRKISVYRSNPMIPGELFYTIFSP